MFKYLIIIALFLWLPITDVFAQGKFVYVDNVGIPAHTVSGFSVEPGGALSPLAGFPVVTGGASNGFGNRLKVSPLGNFLFVSNDIGATVSVFRIHATTGSLTLVPGSPFSTNTGSFGALSFEVSPDEQFLFAGNSAAGKLAVLNIAADGTLTPIQSSPFDSTGGDVDGILKISPDGKFLFWTRPTSEAIDIFSIATDGALTAVSGSPFFPNLDAGFISVDINCTGTLLFLGTEAGDVAVFSIAQNGNLAHIQGSPFHLSVGELHIELSPDNQSVLVGNLRTARVMSFRVSPSGIITTTPISNIFIGDPSNEDRRPIDIRVNQDGSLLFVLSADSTVLTFAIAQDGSLTSVQGSPFTNPGGSGYGATIAAFPPKACLPPVMVYDRCIQDESGSRILKINTTTGEYLLLTCDGVTISGTALITRRGCTLFLDDSRADRRMRATLNNCAANGTATLQILSTGRMFTLLDRNTNNNSCACP
jgi:6-phosphogluconolactonase (cycloisomerase 2 family)